MLDTHYMHSVGKVRLVAESSTDICFVGERACKKHALKHTHTHTGKTTATENKRSKAWTTSFDYKSVSRLSLNIQ